MHIFADITKTLSLRAKIKCGLFVRSQKFDLCFQPIVLVLSVPEKAELFGCSSSSMIPSYVTKISTRHSNVLLLTRNRRLSGNSKRKARPVFIENPPIPYSQASVTKMQSG